MISIGKELRHQMREFATRRINRCQLRWSPAVGPRAVEPACGLRSENDHTGAIPRATIAADSSAWNAAKCLDRSSGNVELLKLTGGKEGHETAIRRPKRVTGTFGVGNSVRLDSI